MISNFIIDLISTHNLSLILTLNKILLLREAMNLLENNDSVKTSLNVKFSKKNKSNLVIISHLIPKKSF